MIWNSASEFFSMGGYALYVWGSVAACALGVLGEVAALRLRRRAALALLQQQDAVRRIERQERSRPGDIDLAVPLQREAA